MDTFALRRAGGFAPLAGAAGVLFTVALLAGLAVLAVVPGTLLGLQTVAVTSGSMQPAIRRGSVVVAERYRGAPLAEGTVVVFRDPAGRGLVTHRVLRRQLDGTYVTRGDANATPDSTPVAGADILAVGRLVVPLAGLPATWWKDGEILKLAAAAGALGLCLWYSRSVLAAGRRDHAPAAERERTHEPEGSIR